MCSIHLDWIKKYCTLDLYFPKTLFTNSRLNWIGPMVNSLLAFMQTEKGGFLWYLLTKWVSSSLTLLMCHLELHLVVSISDCSTVLKNGFQYNAIMIPDPRVAKQEPICWRFLHINVWIRVHLLDFIFLLQWLIHQNKYLNIVLELLYHYKLHSVLSHFFRMVGL